MQLLFSLLILSWLTGNHPTETPDTVFCTHNLVLENGLIVPWYEPRDKAFDHFLRLRWDFVLNRVPLSPGPLPRSSYPQYYFYCAFKDNHGTPEPDTWMNDVGEKIPNWFENARLYYAYTGDSRPMDIVRRMIDYSLEHGTSPANFAWPGIPYTTTNAGDTVFRGFTSAGRFSLHEIQVDHAGEMGLTYFRMYQYSGQQKYLDAALRIADVLAQKARNGTDQKSVWPYRVIMNTGKVTAEYGANWTGCYLLLDNLVKAGLGNVKKYAAARARAQAFLLTYPMKSGYWTDGHSDTHINSHTYKSNLSASNTTLFLFDHPEFTPRWKQDIPALIRWTEDNFINRSAPGEPSHMWGANIVGEQDSFLYKMDYQTARYAAACARWYAVSGDPAFREKAYRSLSLVTYCNDSTGMAFESPFSHGILSWWSDCYGECPRMFYQAFAGVPEWAPSHENHILYSEGILKNVSYTDQSVQYEATSDAGTEFLRLNFKPGRISVNGTRLEFPETGNEAVEIRKLDNGDYALTLHRVTKGLVVISSPTPEPDDWYAGDIHVHRDCGGPENKVLPESEFVPMMRTNNLAVISVLADMGDGEVKFADQDLPKVTGKDAPQSVPGRIVHYDAEWHWDPAGTTFEHKALGGHIVLLGMSDAQKIWDESPYKILAYGKERDGITGFCHTEYLNDQIPQELNCCIPMEYPVEAALGTYDFFSEDVYSNTFPPNSGLSADATVNAYYRLLNCGFRLGLAAGTDYPCNNGEPLGSLLTYVNVPGELTYRKWVDGIKNGRTVVARNGHREFLNLEVDGQYTPGDAIRLTAPKTISAHVIWTSIEQAAGTIEVVCNGKVIGSAAASVQPGKPASLDLTVTISESGWLCARRMDANGHQTHTAPVYITLNDQPVRASADDALFFVKWIDNLLEKTSPGGPWNQYFTHDLNVVQDRYRKARDIYLHIAEEARERQSASATHPVLLLTTGADFSSYTAEILKTEGYNLFQTCHVGSEFLNPDFLRQFDVVVLPEMPLTDKLATMLSSYVTAGGNLIAFRPDRMLFPVLGIGYTGTVIPAGTVAIDTTTGMGHGLPGAGLQLHTPAEVYTLSGASLIARIKESGTSPEYPGVVSHSTGKGTAITFSYNLPANILFTRQGNPAHAGLEKDGINGIRGMDLFTDGWVDTSLNTLNQADAQMHLFSHAIGDLCGSRMPLPRLWYFPDTLACLAVLDNDGEDSGEADYEPQFRNVDSLDAKMSLYVKETGKVSRSWVDYWTRKGFEIAGHPDDTREATRPTWQGMDSALSRISLKIATSFDLACKTNVNHWFVWCGTDSAGKPDFAAQAKLEARHGIQMDANFAHYDMNSNQGIHYLGTPGYNQGNFTGSGLVMKYSDADGRVIPVYQRFNAVYDQEYMERKDPDGYFYCFKGLADRSMQNGIYSIISIKSHNDEYFFSREPLMRILSYAKSKQVPVWTARELLDFLQMKDEAAFSDIRWLKDRLTFRLVSNVRNAHGLTVMIPAHAGGKTIRSVQVDYRPASVNLKSIKGVAYAFVTVAPGSSYNLQADYSE